MQAAGAGGDVAPDVAARSAERIRHRVALSRARSPHPRAAERLLATEEDPAVAVRLTVVQAAARMETPGSLALLRRRTHDADAVVRSEAVRLLALREAAGEK